MTGRYILQDIAEWLAPLFCGACNQADIEISSSERAKNSIFLINAKCLISWPPRSLGMSLWPRQRWAESKQITFTGLTSYTKISQSRTTLSMVRFRPEQEICVFSVRVASTQETAYNQSKKNTY